MSGDGRITNYFPRLTPSSSNPRTPSQYPKKQSKRTRSQDEEPESSKENSRKKPKGRKKAQADEEDDLLPSTSTKKSTRSSRKVLKNVIEIEDTPPSSPLKATPCRETTPPSSPLPVLTPSPESSFSRSASFATQSGLDDTAHTTPSPFTTSMDNSYAERQEIELELIPSSQTQNMDTQFHEDNAADSITPSPLDYLRSGEQCSQTSESNTMSQYFTPPDEIIPSSQTQLMDIDNTNQLSDDVLTSPVDEFDVVQSSQSQELTYSQINFRRLERASTTSEQRKSLLDVYLNTPPEVSTSQNSGTSNENVPENSDQGANAELDGSPPFIPSSQPPICTSRSPSPDTHEPQEPDDYLPSSQRSEPSWDEERSFEESLPDAVKEFQQMFGDDAESYPPDFPESLRE